MPVMLEVKVVPSSGRSVFLLGTSGRLKAYLKSPPERGKANDELVTLLAKGLSCPKRLITIVLGATSRTKRVRIDLSLTQEEVFSKLGLAVQTSFME